MPPQPPAPPGQAPPSIQNISVSQLDTQVGMPFCMSSMATTGVLIGKGSQKCMHEAHLAQEQRVGALLLVLSQQECAGHKILFFLLQKGILLPAHSIAAFHCLMMVSGRL